VPATAGTAVLFGPGERHTVHNPSAEPLLVLSAYWIPDEDATATDAR
jgi:mannose-6-phosphate isomerase-like protein (cupin superfamily)